MKGCAKAVGDTPKEAFCNLWDAFKFTDDVILAQDKEGKWHVKLTYVTPTIYEMRLYEQFVKEGGL